MYITELRKGISLVQDDVMELQAKLIHYKYTLAKDEKEVQKEISDVTSEMTKIINRLGKITKNNREDKRI